MSVIWRGGVHARKITINEAERLQTLPSGYTKIEGLKDSIRHKLVGNAWTVDVITHILKHITSDN